MARGGRGKIRKKARLNNSQIKSERSYGITSGTSVQRSHRLISKARKEPNKPFIQLRRNSVFKKRGLFMFRGKKLHLLQDFDSNRVQPKRKPTLLPASRRTAQQNIRSIWDKRLTQQLNRMGVR